jgi:hypothetical protein
VVETHPSLPIVLEEKSNINNNNNNNNNNKRDYRSSRYQSQCLGKRRRSTVNLVLKISFAEYQKKSLLGKKERLAS